MNLSFQDRYICYTPFQLSGLIWNFQNLFSLRHMEFLTGAVYLSGFCSTATFSVMFFFQAPFNELSPETLNAEVMKYVKDVLKLEKGLPPNGVVPILKEKVDNMRVKVSEIMQNFIVAGYISLSCYIRSL